jgi:phosphoribosyl 1,2-cyclic phosphodiesterase/CheY-like chemotaxis protein
MKTVLLIDDEPVTRKLFAKFLTEAGWQTLEAEDGDEGIALALQHKPDVVLCDLLMPRCNGFQVCRKLREHKSELPNTTILVTSSRDYAIDRLNALEAGADDYLLKPLRPADLLRVMEQVTVGSGQPKPSKTPAPAAPLVPARSENRFRFWGVRGSIPTPGPSTVFYGGNTSCIEVQADGEIVILDSGSGIRPLGLHLVGEFKERPMRLTVLLTHTHWDHIQGFPFFIPAYNPQNRLTVIGFEGSRQGLESTLIGQMESTYFPIGLRQMPGHLTFTEAKDMQFKVGEIQVTAAFTNHPGICVGYRLETRTGSLVFIPDHEPFMRMRTTGGQAGKEGEEAVEFARAEDRRMVDFIRGADNLIIDSQYDVAEYQKHVGWGHSCVDDSVALAIEAKVKRLFLFHHDPRHDDEWVSRTVAHARQLAAAARSDLVVEAAREGFACDLAATPSK